MNICSPDLNFFEFLFFKMHKMFKTSFQNHKKSLSKTQSLAQIELHIKNAQGGKK
jgi:hypothetical protein